MAVKMISSCSLTNIKPSVSSSISPSVGPKTASMAEESGLLLFVLAFYNAAAQQFQW